MLDLMGLSGRGPSEYRNATKSPNIAAALARHNTIHRVGFTALQNGPILKLATATASDARQFAVATSEAPTLAALFENVQPSHHTTLSSS